MAEVRVGAGKQISSLREAAERLASREQFVICVPSQEQIELLRCSLTPGLTPHVIVCDALPGKTAPEAVEAAKKTLTSLQRKKIVLVEMGGSGPSWRSKEPDLLQFREMLGALLERRGTRSVWILFQKVFSARALATMKDRPRFFAEITNVGVSQYCQFLTAKGTFAPAFFYPRKIHLGDPHAPLDPPSLPSAEERLAAAVNASTVPQAVFAGKKIVFGNRAFRTAFPTVSPDDGTVTLREFFGKKNAGLLKSLSAAQNEAGAIPEMFDADAAIQGPAGEQRVFIV